MSDDMVAMSIDRRDESEVDRTTSEPAEPSSYTDARSVTNVMRVLLAVLALYQPWITTMELLLGPAGSSERRYLYDLGVTARHLRQITRASYYQTASMVACYFTFSGVLVAVSLGIPFKTNVVIAAVVVTPFLALARLVWASLTTQNRILASVVRCVRLLILLHLPVAPGTERGRRIYIAPQLTDERALRNQAYVRRRMQGVAWALTRDSARLTGRPVAAGGTVGEVLLWFADNPADRRRRNIVSPYLVELVTAVADGAPIPEAQFAPAARFRTRSPRARILQQLRSTLSGALATGVVVAVLTALLKIWFR